MGVHPLKMEESLGCLKMLRIYISKSDSNFLRIQSTDMKEMITAINYSKILEKLAIKLLHTMIAMHTC
jgi:hypothetical protein